MLRPTGKVTGSVHSKSHKIFQEVILQDGMPTCNLQQAGRRRWSKREAIIRMRRLVSRIYKNAAAASFQLLSYRKNFNSRLT